MTAENSERPNIIVILADDMGYSDIGCFGSGIRTPNLDSLGYNGLRFSQMYNSARCCPSAPRCSPDSTPSRRASATW